MRRIPRLFLPILIVFLLLLSAAPNGTAQNQSPRPTAHRETPLTKKRKESPAATQAKIVNPAATAVTEPTLQAPNAQNPSAEIQQDSQHKYFKKFDWVAFWSNIQTVLQILFTLITTVATVYLAKFTYRLVTVTKDMHSATMAATKAAEQSAQIAILALNANRPFLFIEDQTIHFYPVGRSIRGLFEFLQESKRSDITADPLSQSGRYESAKMQTFFDVRSRGKSVAIIEKMRIRVLLGDGLIKDPTRKLRTISKADIPISNDMLDPNYIAKYYGPHVDFTLESLSEIVSFKAGLIIVVLIRYRDVFQRLFVATFQFSYRPPVRGTDGTIINPQELLPLARKHRRYT